MADGFAATAAIIYAQILTFVQTCKCGAMFKRLAATQHGQGSALAQSSPPFFLT